jgi:NAD(P)-dependent dehydrogenase (short-subunit alcohol dehydrogenase family)
MEPGSSVHGDLTDEKTVKRIADEIRTHLSPIDILVNTAGGYRVSGDFGTWRRKPKNNDALFISLEDLRTVLDGI